LEWIQTATERPGAPPGKVSFGTLTVQAGIKSLQSFTKTHRATKFGVLSTEVFALLLALRTEIGHVAAQAPHRTFELSALTLKIATDFIESLTGKHHQVELVENDPGTGKVLTSSLDIGRAHIHGNGFDLGGIAAVLDQCLGKGPEMVKYGCKKIILSSTANLFDDPLRASLFKAIDEEERIVPGSPYGESKFILERILHWMDRIYGIRSARLRYFNAAGATVERGEDHRPELHIIPLTLKVALGQRESISVFGGDWPTPDGSPVRDFIHVSDLARAHILALDRLEKGSVFYNLGNGAGHSILDVVDTARKVTGVKIPARIVDRRPGDPAVLVAASDKIRRELGWKPNYPGLEEIIGSAWAWHSAHPDGYTTSMWNHKK